MCPCFFSVRCKSFLVIYFIGPIVYLGEMLEKLPCLSVPQIHAFLFLYLENHVWSPEYCIKILIQCI